MTLSTIIKNHTDHGHTVVIFLINVMHGRLPGFEPSHRITAASLLIAYGRDEDDHATDFISHNSQRDLLTRPATRATRRSLRAAGIHPVLYRLIMSQTDDGRLMVDFFVDVMEGKIDGAHPRHRMAAAKELLARGFGKCSPRRLPPTPRATHAPQPSPYDQYASDELRRKIMAIVEEEEEREEQHRVPEQQADRQPQPHDHDTHPDPEPSTPEDSGSGTTAATTGPDPDTTPENDPVPAPRPSISLTTDGRRLNNPNTHAIPTFNPSSYHY